MKLTTYLINGTNMLLLGGVLFLSSCSKDDDTTTSNPNGNGVNPVEATVDIQNANQITESIQIDGATTVAGNPPAPSTDPGTPVIANQDIGIKTSQDGQANITLDYSGVSLVGFYFQIEGANSYLDIPVTSGGGRKMEDASTTLTIDLVAAFEPGTFCGDICVYDAENRVSQPVTICVEILELGGANSAFLIGTWNLTGSKGSDGQIISVGQDRLDEESIECQDQTHKTFNRVSRINNIQATFTNDGGMTVDGSEYKKRLNWDISTCENLVFEEETEVIDFNGIWTYNETSKRLDMVLQDYTDNEQEVVSFMVTQNGSDIELAFIEGGGEDEVLYFSKQ